MIKAIETRYKGYRFRSRLEARWAVFFDAIGWEWKYEHQGYVIGWHEHTKVGWLPDFEIKLPGGQEFYVEVKGDPDFFANGQWLDLLDFDGGPPGFQHSHPDGMHKLSDNCKRIIILGGIPPKGFGMLSCIAVCHWKGVMTFPCSIGPRKISPLARLGDYFWGNSLDDAKLEDFQPKIFNTPYSYTAVMEAINKARSARFEHGEMP
jgi:hypothetical protein